MKLATIGFGKKGAKRFVELLQQAGVGTVVDTRRRPDSPLSGYARQRDLPFILATAGIAYEHRLELAPPDDLLERYRADKNWSNYVEEFNRRVLAAPEAQTAMDELLRRASSGETVALLCSEPTPERCHRRLVAERIATSDDIEIVHLI